MKASANPRNLTLARTLRQLGFVVTLAALLAVLALPLLAAAPSAPTCSQPDTKTDDNPTVAASTNLANSLLWQVTGNGLTEPSYLFGTLEHQNATMFLGANPVVLNKYNESRIVVGELSRNADNQAALLAARQMPTGSSLSQLLTPSQYTQVDHLLRTHTAYDISMVDHLCPLAVLELVRQGVYASIETTPGQAGVATLPQYFQQQAKAQGKQVVSLSTVDAYAKARYGTLPLQRQAEILSQVAATPAALTADLQRQLSYYRLQDIARLQTALFGGSLQPTELQQSVYRLAQDWLGLLPSLFVSGRAFVAVDVQTLLGTKGLIEQLRAQGYTVTPVNTATATLAN